MIRNNHSAFTLIELLIVVAIIGILAAIAVPNFLGALTKAKTARSQADMRSIKTAIEAYSVDWNVVPFPADEAAQPIPYDSPTVFWFETITTPVLTTPIAYMSSLPNDLYKDNATDVDAVNDAGENKFYHYYTRRYVQKSTGSDQGFDEYLQFVNMPSGGANYILLGHGPDGDHDAPGEGYPASYNVTNGILSNGDMLLLGP